MVQAIDPATAVRCLVQLSEAEPLSVVDIARFEGLDPGAVHQILRCLAQAGLVREVLGGYHLARAESSIRVGDIRLALEGAADAFPGSRVTLAELVEMDAQAFGALEVAVAG